MEDSKEKKKRRKRSWISNVVLVIAVAVFLFSGVQLYCIYSEYEEGEDEYERVIQEVITIEKTKPESEDADSKEQEEIIFQVDFDKLLSINSEVVAWIRFDEPSIISYPVVQTQDNDKYLKTTVEGNRNSAGTLFVDTNNTGDFNDKNTFIYGHNMKNGSMFGKLREYKDAAFCEQNPYFYIYTPDGKEITYRVFAVAVVESVSETYSMFFENDQAYADYIKHIRDISRYDVDVEVTPQSQIVSLSTCTNVTETQRLVVHGVKISEKMVGE